jgi:hypothetical protein
VFAAPSGFVLPAAPVPQSQPPDLLAAVPPPPPLAPDADVDVGLPLSPGVPADRMERVRELARGLDHDWMKCYRFVRDNIDFAPYKGILRGPERTLTDREGNDADQAFLLLALLRASGYDPSAATVMYIPMSTNAAGALTKCFFAPASGADGWGAYSMAAWLDVPEEAAPGSAEDGFMPERISSSSG